MKIETRINRVKGELLSAFEKARRARSPGILFSELQNIVQENQKSLAVALPETVAVLQAMASLDINDYCLERSGIDMDARQRGVEAHFPNNWKGVAERLDSIARELLLYKVKRKCRDCDAPEMSVMIESQTGRWVYYCAECDHAESFGGLPAPNVNGLRTPKKKELEEKGMSCRL